MKLEAVSTEELRTRRDYHQQAARRSIPNAPGIAVRDVGRHSEQAELLGEVLRLRSELDTRGRGVIRHV